MELQSFFIIYYSLITDNFFLCWISSGGEPQRRLTALRAPLPATPVHMGKGNSHREPWFDAIYGAMTANGTLRKSGACYKCVTTSVPQNIRGAQAGNRYRCSSSPDRRSPDRQNEDPHRHCPTSRRVSRGQCQRPLL